MPGDGADDQRGPAYGFAAEDMLTTFVLRPPRLSVLVRLRGRNPLLRTIDRVEALIIALTVLVSVTGLPFALAVGSEHLSADTESTTAAVAAAIMAGVAGTAVALCAATRAVCDRIRHATWQRGLDSLADHRSTA